MNGVQSRRPVAEASHPPAFSGDSAEFEKPLCSVRKCNSVIRRERLLRHRSTVESCDPAGCSSAWLERYVRDVEVAGSNPVIPTAFLAVLLQHSDFGSDQRAVSWRRLLCLSLPSV